MFKNMVIGREDEALQFLENPEDQQIDSLSSGIWTK
jgi:hypothetical protein